MATCRTGYCMQAVADPARLKTNPRPKWPVPEEVIEWQPSYVQKGAPFKSSDIAVQIIPPAPFQI